MIPYSIAFIIKKSSSQCRVRITIIKFCFLGIFWTTKITYRSKIKGLFIITFTIGRINTITFVIFCLVFFFYFNFIVISLLVALMTIVIVVTVKNLKLKYFVVIFVVTIFTLVVTFVIAEQLVLPNITGDILERSDSFHFLSL